MSPVKQRPGKADHFQPIGDLMANPAPVVSLVGTVHSATKRDVKAQLASDAVRDPETGRVVVPAREAREAYSVHDVLILTEAGGFANLILGSQALAVLEGRAPERGDSIDWPVRPFIKWAGQPGRKFPTVEFSVAGEVFAEHVNKGKSTGARIASVS